MVSNIADINEQELEDDESIFRDLLDETAETRNSRLSSWDVSIRGYSWKLKIKKYFIVKLHTF